MQLYLNIFLNLVYDISSLGERLEVYLNKLRTVSLSLKNIKSVSHTLSDKSKN